MEQVWYQWMKAYLKEIKQWEKEKIYIFCMYDKQQGVFIL